MTAPAGAKKPQDRKPTAAAQLEATLSDDELLADLPELKSPGRLRLRQRNVIMAIALRLNAFVGDDDDSDEGLSLDENDPRLPQLLDILAEIDEFAESIAVNREAYVEWAEGKDYDHFTALLQRYASAVGESTASSS
jgi:hypothetical protein